MDFKSKKASTKPKAKLSISKILNSKPRQKSPSGFSKIKGGQAKRVSSLVKVKTTNPFMTMPGLVDSEQHQSAHKNEGQQIDKPTRVTLFETQLEDEEESAPAKKDKRVSLMVDDELKQC